MDEDKQNRLFMAGLARELPLALDKKETELWKALDSTPTMKDVIDMIDTLVLESKKKFTAQRLLIKKSLTY